MPAIVLELLSIILGVFMEKLPGFIIAAFTTVETVEEHHGQSQQENDTAPISDDVINRFAGMLR